jgi:Ser/Thr protein kinase RdoA (MazF antagonist)
MMRLRLMKRFFDTVDEGWKSPIVDKIAARWFKGGVDARVLRASANFVVVIKADDRKYFLRFNHSSERTTGFIAAELEYIIHLRGRGVNANVPIKSLKGNYIESVETEMGVFHCVVFEGLPGVQIESEELDLDGFERWGTALGELHEASDGYRDPRIPSWKDHAEFIRETVTEPIILKELEALEKRLESLPVGDNYGVSHYDFEQDNLFWDNGVPGILDFDDLVYFWHTCDIANALQDLHHRTSNEYDPEDPRIQAFIKGYRSNKRITDEDLQTIPLVILFDKIYVYARLVRSIEGSETPGEPEWVTDLRGKLADNNKKTLEYIEGNPLGRY